ncbi:MAG: DUF4835 family protein [Prevotellaceae bacterium]|jgi:hypothetical protein|nr:DUF4835 family protein [Prevotellaceae bacterium]
MGIKRIIYIALLTFSLFTSASSQELNAVLTINSDKIQGANKQVFNTLQTDLTEFVNTRKWTSATFAQNERIDCNFTIIVNKMENNLFSCEIQIQARRPVYNSTYTTTIFNFRDIEFDFEYTEFAPLEYTENMLNNNLTATIIYYIYMILGFDFDSFSPGGGKEFFQQAMQIVTLAQSAPSWNGWKPFTNNKNRHALATALTENQGDIFHTFWYNYHRKGLDEMAANADRGRANIIAALPNLKTLKDAKPNSVLLQLFQDCKLDETVVILSKATMQEKEEEYKLFSHLFPAATSRFENLKR